MQGVWQLGKPDMEGGRGGAGGRGGEGGGRGQRVDVVVGGGWWWWWVGGGWWVVVVGGGGGGRAVWAGAVCGRGHVLEPLKVSNFLTGGQRIEVRGDGKSNPSGFHSRYPQRLANKGTESFVQAVYEGPCYHP